MATNSSGRKGFVLSLLCFLIFSCVNNMVDINRLIDIEVDPDVILINAKLHRTDSARLRMIGVAPIAMLFSSAEVQRNEYPEGLQVWLYEDSGELRGEFRADWVRRNPVDEIWEARGNVVLQSADGDVLETEQFFWDEKRKVIYSEMFTTITYANGSVTRGIRFTANEDFTNMRLPQATATIVLEDEIEDKDDNIEELVENTEN